MNDDLNQRRPAAVGREPPSGTDAAADPRPAGRPSASSVRVEQGTCYVFFAHDIGLSIDLNEAEQRITTTTQRKTIRPKRRAPRYFEYRPSPLCLSSIGEPVVLGEHRTSGTVDLMIYDFGGVSVAYSIPLSGPLDGLLPLSDELYDNARLLADSQRSVEQLLTMIEPAVSKPNIADIAEDYCIYQIERFAAATPLDRLVTENAPLLAQILRAETALLSEQEVQDALGCRVSYGQNDALIVDWNAALLLDHEAEDVRAVLEFANVELLERRYLDDQLDEALDVSYETLTRRRWTEALLVRPPAADLRRIGRLQVDSAILFEGVSNALKILGDQYLARVYRLASQRLHVPDWDTSILRKLQTLESIYQKISDHQTTRRMEVLEWIIIVLIAISIAVSFVPGLTH